MTCPRCGHGAHSGRCGVVVTEETPTILLLFGMHAEGDRYVCNCERPTILSRLRAAWRRWWAKASKDDMPKWLQALLLVPCVLMLWLLLAIMIRFALEDWMCR